LVVARFNHHELYIDDNTAVPREFEKDTGDFHIFWWDAVYDNSLDQKETLATLYNSAIATFGSVHKKKLGI
jgi:hypothetical protein